MLGKDTRSGSIYVKETRSQTTRSAAGMNTARRIDSGRDLGASQSLQEPRNHLLGSVGPPSTLRHRGA
jgi:hypothetical protein